MSEYWKSTPKYWCKHCNTYVRDTKIERANHEATIKHQNNLNKFLRNIHRDNSRAEREKQRAKDEVARLNGTQVAERGPERKERTSVRVNATSKGQATAEERRNQMAQLADMGVTVPDEYRKDFAMVGAWQNISEPRDRIETRSMVDITPVAFSTDGGDQSTGLGMLASRVPAADGPEQKPRIAWGSKMKKYSDIKSSSTDLESFLQSYKSDDTSDMSKAEIESADTKREQVDTGFLEKQRPVSFGSKRQRNLKLSDEEEEEEEEEDVVFKKRRPKHVKK